MDVYFEDKLVRYRTEAFSGLGERNAAEVMAFETFSLGNVDILQTLAEGTLKGRGEITNRCWDFIDELNNNGFVDDMSITDQVAFMNEVLAEVAKVTGVEVQYALWLADRETVTDRKWYGRYMAHDEDFESYQIGPVVLSDLGFDGTLYGYEEMPVSLETRLEYAEDDLINIINEREGLRDGSMRAEQLDDLYAEKDNVIQLLKEVIGQKTHKNLDAKLQDAQRSCAQQDESGTHDVSKEGFYELSG